MANVKFFISGTNTYPTPDVKEAGALYFNYKLGTICYSSDGASMSTVVSQPSVTQHVFSSDRCTYQIATYKDAKETKILYGKRCVDKLVSIPLTGERPPMAVGDTETAYKTLAEADLGGAFVGFDIVDFTPGVAVNGYSWDDFWSVSRNGVQIGNTTTGGTASYKISVKVSCTAQVPNNAMTNLGTATVSVRVYYIPF